MSDTIDCPYCEHEHKPTGSHEDDEAVWFYVEHSCNAMSKGITSIWKSKIISYWNTRTPDKRRLK